MATRLLWLTTNRSESSRDIFRQPTLTWDDLKAIRSEIDSVQAAAPLLRSSVNLVAETGNWGTQLTGTTPD